MLQVVKGVYDNGQVILDEIPGVKNKTQVIVTFLDKRVIKKQATGGKRELGLLKGKIRVPDDFNEPLDDLKNYM